MGLNEMFGVGCFLLSRFCSDGWLLVLLSMMMWFVGIFCFVVVFFVLGSRGEIVMS